MNNYYPKKFYSPVHAIKCNYIKQRLRNIIEMIDQDFLTIDVDVQEEMLSEYSKLLRDKVNKPYVCHRLTNTDRTISFRPNDWVVLHEPSGNISAMEDKYFKVLYGCGFGLNAIKKNYGESYYANEFPKVKALKITADTRVLGEILPLIDDKFEQLDLSVKIIYINKYYNSLQQIASFLHKTKTYKLDHYAIREYAEDEINFNDNEPYCAKEELFNAVYDSGFTQYNRRTEFYKPENNIL
jgi:hypothetical protein